MPAAALGSILSIANAAWIRAVVWAFNAALFAADAIVWCVWLVV